MRLRAFAPILLFLAFAPELSSAAPAASRTIVLRGAKIVPVVGEDIPAGTIVIKDGRIDAVGADLAVPAGAEIVDAAGLVAYPGMIDAYGFLGLTEVGAVAATADQRETGRLNPQVRTIEALRYDSMHIPIARSNGITSALVAPAGGLVAGMSCLVKLDGWTNREMVRRTPAALHIELASLRAGRGGFGPARVDTGQALEELKALFSAARFYDKRRRLAAETALLARPEVDETAEALLPVLRGEVPVMISVHAEKDIRRAIDFVRTEGLKAVFYGVEQGFKAAAELAASGIPAVMGSLYDLPPVSEDGYDSLYRNPGELHRAGVKIAFASASAAMAKDLPYHAAKAAAFGLDRREALKAVTINPAEIFGLGTELGSLEKGKRADIVLADGDLLEQRTNIKRVFIDGRDTDLGSRYTELLEKFKKRETEEK